MSRKSANQTAPSFIFLVGVVMVVVVVVVVVVERRGYIFSLKGILMRL